MKVICYGSILLCMVTLNVLPVFGVFEKGGSIGFMEREATIWTGRDKDGKVISKSEIDRIIQCHKRWLETKGEKGEKANLKSADLKGINLWKVNLSNASLEKVNFENASLMWVNFKGADLSEANIQKGNLWEANLEESNLMGTNLTGADLSGANLKKAVFELESKKAPNIQLLAMSDNLHTLTYKNSPHSLIEIRKAFKETGFRRQERALSYAIHHNRIQNDAGILERWSSYVLFEFTCNWGMHWLRPIQIMVLVSLLLWGYYSIWVLPGKDEENGIWKVWPEGSLQKRKSQKKETLLTVYGWENVWYGFYFSLLSAFHIGWRDFNVGSWIGRMQRRDYTLRATGWPRMVSGIQSLICVYLLALSLLTYFGRPFD